jgi:hypothetical protein
MFALVLRRYEFERLDARAGVGMEGRLRPNAFLILQEVKEDSVLDVGSLVEAHVRIPDSIPLDLPTRDGLLLSRIAAMPGAVLSLQPTADGLLQIFIDGERTPATVTEEELKHIGADRRIDNGPIPPDHYLLLNPSLRAPAWDSRRLGLIRRSELTRRILTYF